MKLVHDLNGFVSIPWRHACASMLVAMGLLQSFSVAPAQSQTFTQFEARQTHSIALTPDGTRLLALNSPAGSLSVFEISPETAKPLLLTEIPVGLEPVSVAARTSDEVWVVNEVSDSVSVVSLSRKAVVATLPAPDEPADIVFAQGKAFVSCARNGLLRVFDLTTKAELPSIPLAGIDPRALATDAAGNFIFAAFHHSGNRTTILPRTDAPPQPAPTAPNLPDAPNTALIVSADDVRIPHKVLDRDVAVIDASLGQVVAVHGGIGTSLFGLAIQPTTGNLWIANTEALNLIRFEPTLRGHFVDHRITGLNLSTGAKTVVDLNRGTDYGILPNSGAHDNALAQPTSLLFANDRHAWIAAFASDRVAKVDTSTGNVMASIDVRRGGGSSSSMRGPRALALNSSGTRLYVLNKIADSVTVIDANTNLLLEEVPLTRLDTMPASIRAGRGFLFDARLSGNGTASCAACHIDADRDGLAWDLGNPSGEMVTVQGANLSVHDLTPRGRVMHPMKGPMVTQTLRGMENGAPFHWRGDRPSLQSFNPTFDRLMGGSELESADIDKMAAYLLSLRNHPNPNREKSGALPSTFANGNPTRGEMLFNLHDNHCGICHLPPKGSDNNIDLPLEVGSSQPIKNPPLGTVYQRLFFDPTPGATSLSGFGLLHDGTGSGLALPTVHPYVLDQLSTLADFLDVQAFVLCFDTGTSPAVGDTITLTAQNIGSADTSLTRFELLSPTLGQLVAFASIGGIQHRFLYSRTLQRYIPESVSESPLTRQALVALLGPTDAVTFMGVPPSEGSRFAGATARGAAPRADSYFVPSTGTLLRIPVIQGVLANDANIAPSHDTAEVVSPAGAGETAFNSDGSFSYTPSSAFATADLDSFEYRILLAGDAGNATAATTATISTIASAAGQYSGVLTSADQHPSGLVNITVSPNGRWTGSARIGSKVIALKGTLAVDGTLQSKHTPPFDLALRLSALKDGQRRIAATSSASEGSTLSGTVTRSAYSKSSPAPNGGRHHLTMTAARIIGDGPEKSGPATLKLKTTGAASLVGKLGDGTRFSCSGVVVPRIGAGWSFALYAAVYKAPAGTVSGELQFDAGSSSGIVGTATAFKPPQTRPGLFQGGFTVEYAVAE